MAEHLYTGLVSKQLRGNREDALTLEREARIKVGYLFDRLRPGQTFGSGSWSLGGGRRILAFVWNDVLGKRATVRLTGAGGKEKILEFWCESGLLTWDVLTPSYPLDIYLGDKLKAIDGSPPLTNGHYDSHLWLADMPALEYPDYTNDGYVDLAYWPSMWTGKARLMMQALHADARDPAEIFTYVGIDPNEQGLWTTGIAEYWVVHIQKTGATITKLVLPEDVPDKAMEALALLTSGEELTEIQKSVAEACVLKVLVRSGDPIELLSESDLALVVTESGGASIQAMAYGWKFARNKLEASIVTFRHECMPEYMPDICIGKFVTSLFTITANYDRNSGDWSASVARVHGPVECRPRTAVTSIYVPLYGALYRWYMTGMVPEPVVGTNATCCYVSFAGNIQAQYCWYDKNDVLQVVWYLQYQDESEAVDTLGIYDPPGVDNPSFSWSGQIGEVGTRKGGFHVGPTEPTFDDYTDEFSSYKDQSYSVTVSPGEWVLAGQDSPFTSMTSFYAGAVTSSGGGALIATVEGYGYQIKHVDLFTKFGTQSERFESQQTIANPRLWSLVIAPYDAEAAYLLMRGSSKTVGPLKVFEWSGSEYSEGYPVWGGYTRYDFYKVDPLGEFWWSEELTVVRGKIPNNYMYGSWFGTMINLGDESKATDTTEEVTTSPHAESYRVLSPHGEIELPSGGSWTTLFPESVTEGTAILEQPVKALFSYTGDGLYFTEEGTQADKGGYPVGAPGIGAFFIGGA